MTTDRSLPVHWPSAVRARTVLAVCHEVWSEPAGVEPGVPVCAGLLDVAGVPHLLPPAQPTWMAAGLELTCTAVLDDLGLVRMTGLLGQPVRAGSDPRLAQALRDHRGCLAEEVGPLDQLRLAPLSVSAVSVLAPDRLVADPLDPELVRRTDPDWLLAHSSQLIGHLDDSHADGLLRLARDHGSADASVASMQQLTRTGLALACLTPDGVTTVQIPFDPPVEQPADLWRRLAEQWGGSGAADPHHT